METKKLKFTEISSKLNLPTDVIQAYAKAGLFGYFENNEINEDAVDFFEKYKTYWPKQNEKRLAEHIFRNDSNRMVIPNILGGVQPPSTVHELQISANNQYDNCEIDKGWLAQFFFKPNLFFFPNPEELALIGPIGIKLRNVIKIHGTDLPCYICPDPNGHLAMIMVEAICKSTEKALFQAESIINPIIDELAFKYDQPLPISHHIIVGIPSGVISIKFKKLNQISELESNILPRSTYPELDIAISLYREAISSNNPFHQFLTFWKVYENVCSIRGAWRKKNKKSDTKIYNEFFPPMFAFTNYSGKSFDQAKQIMNNSYRVAIAHGVIKQGVPRTWSKDYDTVSLVVPVIRYMAYTTLINMRRTLEDS